jgi:hypothetical protein
VTPTKVEKRALIAGTIIVLAILAVAFTVAVAGAAERETVVSTAVVPVATSTVSVATSSSAPASASVNASSVISGRGTFALDFTLPTFGKSGCLVCHGDKNLIVSKGDGTVSYWIDEDMYAGGAHAKIACTGCHIDYGYRTPHGQNGANDWREVAKQACKNCHPQQYADFSLGAHAIRPLGVGQPDPKAANKPLCGDCHGSHFIPVLKNNPKAQAEVQKQSEQMCGKAGCHPDYWANYNDYYHGAAYKTGASDAPACWTCHGTHTILRSTNRLAPTNSENFGASNSCGTAGCHQGAGPAFSSYAPMIHGRDKTVSGNPIVKFLTSVFKHE